MIVNGPRINIGFRPHISSTSRRRAHKKIKKRIESNWRYKWCGNNSIPLFCKPFSHALCTNI